MYSENLPGSSNDCKTLPDGLQPQYRISLTLAVSDGRALWTAAAARLLAAPGMTLDDVVEVIGPCEDPSISDCIATVLKPADVPGCLLDDFWIDAFAKTPPRLVQGDGRSDGGERPVRRSAARRTAGPRRCTCWSLARPAAPTSTKRCILLSPRPASHSYQNKKDRLRGQPVFSIL